MTGKPLAESFVSIRARDGGLHDDVKDIGHRAGTAAGREAGKTFSEKFTETAARGVDSPGVKARFQAAGRADGRTFADGFVAAADGRMRDGNGRFVASGARSGETFGEGFTRGADGKLRDAQGRFVAGLGGSGSGGGSFWDRLGSQSGKEFSAGLGKALKVSLAGIGGVALGASTLATLGAATAGTVAAVKSLSGALLLLPAAGAAFGVTLGTVTVGLSGFAAALDGDEEALRKLTPAARDALDAVDRLSPSVTRLRKTVEARLFDGIAPVIDDLGQRYLPVATDGMGRIADAVNKAGRSFGVFAGQARPIGDVATVLDNTALAAGNLDGVLPSLASAFLTVSRVGSGFLPEGAQSLNDAAARLDDTVQRLADSGRLKEIMEEGIAATGDLIGVLKEAGRIVGGIFDAAGGVGASPLGALEDVLSGVADQIARPEFQAGLGEFFNAIGDGASSVKAALPDVADALVAIAPALASIVRGSGAAFGDFLSDVAGIIQTTAPLVNGLAKAFEFLGPVLGPVLVGLLALKVALLGLTAAEKARGALIKLDGALVKVRGSSKAAAASVDGLGKAGAALAVVGIASSVSDWAGNAFTATVATKKLTDSLKGLGSGTDPGSGLSDLFGTKGVFGQRNNIDATSAALDAFGRNAKAALGDGLFERFSRIGPGDGAQLTQFRKQVGQLDAGLASLARSGSADAAAASFQKFIESGTAQGVNLDELKAKFPEYAAAVRDTSGALKGTDPAIAGFNEGLNENADGARTADLSMRALTLTTMGYATAVLTARGDNRAFQAAIDQATASVRENGRTLNEGTEKGRANAEALDAIAAAGLAVAKNVPEGANAQEYFAGKIEQTRAALIRAARKMGETKDEAALLAEEILGVPDLTIKVSAQGLRKVGLDLNGLKTTIDTVPRSIGIGVRLTGQAALNYQLRHLTPDDGPIAGTRAGGGPVVKGRTYLVGEEGPELFTANMSGMILSAGATRKASAGLDDMTRSADARRSFSPAAAAGPVGPPLVRLHPDDLAVLLRQRPLQVRLDTGVLVGEIDREAGQRL